MKALAIDTASGINLSVQNERKKITLTLDVGMQQAGKLLPTIEYALSQADLIPEDLEFIALSGGPGSFTGLRLGFAAAKGLQLSTGCPVIPIPTLEAHAAPFSSWPGKVIPVIDAKKNRFYAQIFSGGTPVIEAADIHPEAMASFLEEKDKVLLVGPDRKAMEERLLEINPCLDVISFSTMPSITDSLFALAQGRLHLTLPPHEGPLYLRRSEAEENIT